MPVHNIPQEWVLRARAQAAAVLREFFGALQYLEVETPIMRRHASMEPFLVSFETALVAPDGSSSPRYLHTSPEYALKEVVATHGVSVWQLARVFRNEEQGSTHLPEFSMVEWYRVGQDYRFLMGETERLVRSIAEAVCQTFPMLSLAGDTVDLSLPFEQLTVSEAFLRHAGFDPTHMDQSELLASALSAGCVADSSWSWEDLFHLVLLERVESHLGFGSATMLYDYPAKLASLARLSSEQPAVAERFELYVGGVELCNGFSELTDASEQRRRFDEERALRGTLGLPVHDIDEAFLEAVGRLPTCTGNALGWDRLLMLLLEVDDISDVVVGP